MSIHSELGYHDFSKEIPGTSLEFSGKMPSWLQGVYVKNGPSLSQSQGRQVRHAFDAMAMLHSFSFGDGKIIYRSRFLQSKAAVHFFRTGKSRYATFGTPAHKNSLLRKVLGKPLLTDNALVNVAEINGKYLALTETPNRVEFDLSDLSTKGPYHIQSQDKCFREHFATAHPHFDSKSGEYFFLSTKYSKISHYHFYKLKSGETDSRLTSSIPVKRPSYNHSFAVTDRFLILIECPFRVNPIKLVFFNRGIIQNFIWEAKEPTVFTIIDRASGQVVKTSESPAFFMFHIANAYEVGNEVIVDLIRYPDPRLIYETFLPVQDVSLNDDHFLQRFKISLSQAAIKSETIFSIPVEFPRIHYNLVNGKNYTIVYAVGAQASHSMFASLVKVNVKTGHSWCWREDDCFPSEPQFIASNPDKEDVYCTPRNCLHPSSETFQDCDPLNPGT